MSLLELVVAYAPFANGGMAIAPHVVERVRTLDGKLLYARPGGSPSAASIEPRYVAHDERDDARDAAHRHRAQGRVAGLAGRRQDRHLQDFRDAWFIGYTGHLVTGVWLGNDDNSPTKKATGGGLPVEIWSRFMKAAHQGVPVAELPGAARRRVRAHIPRASDAPAPRVAARANIRPEADRGLDGWFLQRLFGRRQ